MRLLVVAVLLAGCLAPATDVTPSATNTSLPPTGVDLAPANDTAALAAAPEASTEATVALAWDGNTGTFVCAPDGVGSCRGMELARPDAVHVPGLPGRATGVTLTVTWTPATPTTLELGAVAGAFEPCGGSCWTWTEAAATRGASPLVLEAPDLALAPGETLGFLVYTPCAVAAPPLFACADVDQAFHVEAAIAVVQ